ncbi:YcnI family protein [Leifsonia bigeumensis]|uniref:YcnI family protein n=1 Tax=Leifsonella bigeumensis TaxID=433643 RepID=A0ABP7FLC7_9MICO
MKKLHIVAAAGAALMLALAAPAAASAHVSVSPDTASPGSYALIDFKVPNESATAVTTKLEVTLPTDTPFSSVSYVPVTGWTAELIREALPTPVTVGENTITEAVTSIVWTADPGHEIATGQLQVFPVSLGPVPDVGSVTFTTLQTYSDGTVVSWAETGEDAEHPAPVLYVGDAPTGDHHGDQAGSADAGESSADAVARGLGVGGLVLGAIGVVVAIAGLRRKEVS